MFDSLRYSPDILKIKKGIILKTRIITVRNITSGCVFHPYSWFEVCGNSNFSTGVRCARVITSRNVSKQQVENKKYKKLGNSLDTRGGLVLNIINPGLYHQLNINFINIEWRERME